MFLLTSVLGMDYHTVGNFRWRKIFANFAVLWLFVTVFSVKFGSVASFGAAKASNLRKFSQQKLYFSLIRESFLPRKFTAIRYLSLPLHSVVVAIA